MIENQRFTVSVADHDKQDILDPRFARRNALLRAGRKYDSLPSSWTAQRSIEASRAAREMTNSLSYRGKVWMMIIAGYAASGVLLYWALHGFS